MKTAARRIVEAIAGWDVSDRAIAASPRKRGAVIAMSVRPSLAHPIPIGSGRKTGRRMTQQSEAPKQAHSRNDVVSRAAHLTRAPQPWG